MEILGAIYFYIRKFKSYDVVYINTTVMLSALVAAAFYRFSAKKYIAILEKYQIGKVLLSSNFCLFCLVPS